MQARTVLTFFANRDLYRQTIDAPTITEAIWSVRHKLPADAMLISAECLSARTSTLVHLWNLQNVEGGVQVYCDNQPTAPVYSNERAALEVLRLYILRELAQEHPDRFNAVAQPGESYDDFRNRVKPELQAPRR